jgi:[ribosomal protein S18]-alanine N-acetyltransferase
MIELLSRLFSRPEPVLSEAQPRDATAMAALHATSFRRGWSDDEFRSMLGDNAVVAHRAMRGSKLIGFIISRMAADESEILSVAVATPAQGRGLAGRLLHLHLRRLAGLGVRTAFLEVGENNTPAIRLYTRAGFEHVSRRQGYYQDNAGRQTAALVLRYDFE